MRHLGEFYSINFWGLYMKSILQKLVSIAKRHGLNKLATDASDPEFEAKLKRWEEKNKEKEFIQKALDELANNRILQVFTQPLSGGGWKLYKELPVSQYDPVTLGEEIGNTKFVKIVGQQTRLLIARKTTTGQFILQPLSIKQYHSILDANKHAPK